MAKRRLVDEGIDDAAVAPPSGEQQASKKRKPNNPQPQDPVPKQSHEQIKASRAVKTKITRPTEDPESGSLAAVSTVPGNPAQPGNATQQNKRARKRQRRKSRRSEHFFPGEGESSPVVLPVTLPARQGSGSEATSESCEIEVAHETLSAGHEAAARETRSQDFDVKESVDSKLLWRAAKTKLLVPPTKHWVEEELPLPVEHVKADAGHRVDCGCQTDIVGQLHLQLMFAPLSVALDPAYSPQQMLDHKGAAKATTPEMQLRMTLATAPVIASDDEPMEDAPALPATGLEEVLKPTAKSAPRSTSAAVSMRDAITMKQGSKDEDSDASADDNSEDDNSEEVLEASADEDDGSVAEVERVTSGVAKTQPLTSQPADKTKSQASPINKRAAECDADSLLVMEDPKVEGQQGKRAPSPSPSGDESLSARDSESSDEEVEKPEPVIQLGCKVVANASPSASQVEVADTESPIRQRAASPPIAPTNTSPSKLMTVVKDSQASPDLTTTPKRTPLFAGIKIGVDASKPHFGRSLSGFKPTVLQKPKVGPAAAQAVDPREAFRRFSEFVGGDESSEEESSGSESGGAEDDGKKSPAPQIVAQPKGVGLDKEEGRNSGAGDEGTAAMAFADAAASGKTAVSLESKDESNESESDSDDGSTPQQPSIETAAPEKLGIGSEQVKGSEIEHTPCVAPEAEEESDESDESDELDQLTAVETATSAVVGPVLEDNEVDYREADTDSVDLPQQSAARAIDSSKTTLSLQDINNARASQQLEDEAQTASHYSQASKGGGKSSREQKEPDGRILQTRNSLRKGRATGGTILPSSDEDAAIFPGKLQKQAETIQYSRAALDKVSGTRKEAKKGGTQAEDSTGAPPPRGKRSNVKVEGHTIDGSLKLRESEPIDQIDPGTDDSTEHLAIGYSEDDDDMTDVPARAPRSNESSPSAKAASASRTSPSVHSDQTHDPSSFLGSRSGSHVSGRARSREFGELDDLSKEYLFIEADDEDVYQTIDEISSDVFSMTRPLPTSEPLRDAKLGAESNGLKRSKMRRRVVKDISIPPTGHDTLASYAVQVDRDEPEPPIQVSGRRLVNHSPKRDRNDGDAPVAQSLPPLLAKMSSSSLSDPDASPVEPPSNLTDEAETRKQGPVDDKKVEATASKKRRMTGSTSKHFTPEKQAKTSLSNIDDDPSDNTPEKRVVKRKRSTPKKSPHFERTYLLDRVDLPSPGRRRVAGVSGALAPSTTWDHFGIIQEKLWDQPFWLLIAVTLLNKTTGRAAVPVFWDLKNRYVTPEALAAADTEHIRGMIQHLGLQNVRTIKMVKMAKVWISQPPVLGKRYQTRNYPKHGNHRQFLKQSIIETDASDCAGALEIGHLPGCGSYAWDSWRIFSRDVARGVAEDYRGKGAATEGFEPEWMRVLPSDKELRVTVKWMWLREGWIWDPENGEKRRATDEETEKGKRGEMELVGKEEAEFAGIAVGLGDRLLTAEG
ncbi:hypothetical protein LTR35_012476 [Friedmanniomyces endolithicus]|nr:hypothetical protein LTR35_012476 [Friedmanniomyces endolithicus]KAK0294628.1 hypothetical protein LTS00_006829 [Friedmanniomyces endolithicus]KAK1009765.1 hypothetical protein LTR54_005561 [Friedmanniomyces endolithicus]